MTTMIQKWGNSYAVRLPKATMRKLNLWAGSSVEILESDRGTTLSIVPIQKPVISLKEMSARITKANQHGVVGWGDAKGKEVW